jgi:hypothetical protein
MFLCWKLQTWCWCEGCDYIWRHSTLKAYFIYIYIKYTVTVNKRMNMGSGCYSQHPLPTYTAQSVHVADGKSGGDTSRQVGVGKSVSPPLLTQLQYISELTSIARLALSNRPNSVGVSNSRTWGWKQIQFPKHCVLSNAKWWTKSINPVTPSVIQHRQWQCKLNKINLISHQIQIFKRNMNILHGFLRSSTAHHMACFVLNLKVHYRVHKDLPMDPILSQMNPAYILFLTIHFNKRIIKLCLIISKIICY